MADPLFVSLIFNLNNYLRYIVDATFSNLRSDGRSSVLA